MAIEGLSVREILISIAKNNCIHLLDGGQEIGLCALGKPVNGSVIGLNVLKSCVIKFDIERISNLYYLDLLGKLTNLGQGSFDLIIVFLGGKNHGL